MGRNLEYFKSDIRIWAGRYLWFLLVNLWIFFNNYLFLRKRIIWTRAIFKIVNALWKRYNTWHEKFENERIFSNHHWLNEILVFCEIHGGLAHCYRLTYSWAGIGSFIRDISIHTHIYICVWLPLKLGNRIFIEIDADC